MKKRIPIILSMLLIATLCGCNKNEAEPTATPAPAASAEPTAGATPAGSAGTAADYYPIRENVHYIYGGEGMEYAPYDVYIHYASDTAVQQRVDNGGTVMARVVRIEDGKVSIVYSREDSYYRQNRLDTAEGDEQILLMDPIEVGTSWTLADGRTRTITDIAASVDTPSGAYTTVAVETLSSYGTTTDYYAKDVGLVKTVTDVGEGYEVISYLAEIEENVPFVQNVRFYYPDGGDGVIYYRDKQLSFYTNDVTRLVLEAAYKEDFEGRPGDVLSENTSINSYYLNEDGMAYIDLSTEFVSEMNAGSGYEAMILQCIANTFGTYSGADKVVLTIDNGTYESGHIALESGEYLTVNTESCVELA